MRSDWRGAVAEWGAQKLPLCSGMLPENGDGRRLGTQERRIDFKQKRINQETGKHSCTMDRKLRQGSNKSDLLDNEGSKRWKMGRKGGLEGMGGAELDTRREDIVHRG